MTNLYVQEFAGLANSGEGGVAVVAQPPLASYVVANTVSPATAGPAYQPGTKFVQVQADGVCSVRFDGTAATVTDQRLAANGPPIIYGVQNVVKAGSVSSIINT